MKITANQLRKIIKEEVQASLNELKKKPRAVQPGALTLGKYIPNITDARRWAQARRELVGEESGLFLEPEFKISLKSKIIPIDIEKHEAEYGVTHKFKFVEDPDGTPVAFSEMDGFQYSDS